MATSTKMEQITNYQLTSTFLGFFKRLFWKLHMKNERSHWYTNCFVQIDCNKRQNVGK